MASKISAPPHVADDYSAKRASENQSWFSGIFSQIVNTFSQTVQDASRRVYSYLPSLSFEEPFYFQVMRSDEFINAQFWCSHFKQECKKLTALLISQNNPSAEKLEKVLSETLQNKNINSPFYFQRKLKQLEKQIREEYKPICERARTSFRNQLQADPKKALTHFYNDILHYLALLSAKKISEKRMLKVIEYYNELVDQELYTNVSKTLNDFIQSETLPSLLKKINRLFAPYVEVKRHNPQNEISTFTILAGAITLLTLNTLSKTAGSSPSHSLARLGAAAFISSTHAAFFDSVIDLHSLNKSTGHIIEGLHKNDLFGYTSIVSDFNGDNISDIAVSSPNAPYNNTSNTTGPGEVYVIFGPFVSLKINISNLNGTNGFTFRGTNPGDGTGTALASADFDGDGCKDLAIGAPRGSTACNCEGPGLGFVIFGKNSSWPAFLTASDLDGNIGYTIIGNNTYEGAGSSITTGNFNGDPYSDLMLGAPYALGPGAGYLILGHPKPYPSQFYVKALTPSTGLAALGVNNGDNTAWSMVSEDFNGDGYDEWLIGAPNALAVSPNQQGSGRVYMLYGNETLSTSFLSLANLTGSDGFFIYDVYGFDGIGFSLTTGNLDGDPTYTDLCTGAPLLDLGTGWYTGTGYCLFGSPNFTMPSFNLSALDGTDGFNVPGINSWAYLGYATTLLDIDYNGLDDLVLCAPELNSDPTLVKNPHCYVLLSQGSYPAQVSILNLDGTDGFTVKSNNTNDRTGFFVTKGKVNDDPIDDLIIGSPYAPYNNESGPGELHVLFGRGNYSINLNTTTNNATTGIRFVSSSSTTFQPKASSTTLSEGARVAMGITFSVVGVTIFAAIYWLLRMRRQGTQNAAVRTNKGYSTITANKHTYELINKINKEQADDLFKQTGIRIPFLPGEEKVDFVLGKGQFSVIRIARRQDNQQFVAVKKIKGEANIKESLQEAEIHTLLKDKDHIMPLLDSADLVDNNGKRALYHFMPLARGNGKLFTNKLSQLEDPSLKQKLFLHFAKEVLTGIMQMHNASAYHQDLKPDNIVIEQTGKVRIIDLGLTRLSRETNEVLAHRLYFSPEKMACNRKEIPNFDRAKADSWAAGITLLEVINNAYPFDLQWSSTWNEEYFKKKLEQIPLLKVPTPHSIWDVIKGLLDTNHSTRLSIDQALNKACFLQVPFYSTEEQSAAFAQLWDAEVHAVEIRVSSNHESEGNYNEKQTMDNYN